MIIELPECLRFLLEPKRYKVAYGGRGGAKSWAFARALIAYAIQKKTRILCVREVQKSIKESVYRLIMDQIALLGVEKCFTNTENSIKCVNGSEFIFEGLFRNVNRIKSLEGVNLCWAEEAEAISEESWQLLIPTIRTPGSEIWISFNPKYEDDPTYKRFVKNPPENSIVKKMNWDDNPWFPDVLKQDMEQDKIRDEHAYKNIWLGEPIGVGAKIWHKYDRSIHCKDFDIKLIKERGNCYMAMDPHSKYYPFCAWIAIVPKDDSKKDFWRIVYDEYPRFEDIGGYYSELRKKLYYTGSLADLSRAIYMRDGTSEHGIKIRKRFIDTRFAKGAGGENWSTTTSGIVQEFAKTDNGGLVFDMPPERIIDVQRDVILQSMHYNKMIEIGQFNNPDFIVMPHCKNIIQSLENHRCEEGAEKEDEKYKDPSDALRICFAGMADEKYKDPRADVKPAFSGVLHSYKGATQTQSWMG